MKRLLHFLKSKARQSALADVSARMEEVAEALVRAAPDGLRMEEALELGQFERWVLLQTVLGSAPHAALHFLHVPKTGGTTLTAALAVDPRFLVISVDGPRDSFMRQVSRLLEDEESKVVFIRAHHGLSMLKQSGTDKCVDFSFTTIRDPAAIHASNVNMIVRRIRRLVEDQSQSKEEKEYAARWLDVMQGRHERDVDFALEILSTAEYRKEMGAVYAKMLDMPGWKNEVQRGRLLCLDMEELDRVFEEGFGYVKPPSRKNVNTDGPLDADQIPGPVLEPLLADDLEIFRFLQASKADPAEVIARLRALTER